MSWYYLYDIYVTDNVDIQDLEEWVAGAGKDGFIYFSLGSAVTPSDMPEEWVLPLKVQYYSI